MLFSLRQQFFYINSDNPEVLRKGRLLHFLILLIFTITVGSVIAGLGQQFLALGTITNFRPLFIYLPAVIIFAWAIFRLTRQGKVLHAAHLFTGGLNLILFITLIVSDANQVFYIPYLMMIGIVVVAALDRIPASIFYTVLTATAVTIFFIISDQYHALDIAVYLLTLIGVCTTFWLTVNDLKYVTWSAEQLTKEVQSKNELWQNRAQQLQLSAEISQKTSYSLDLNTLLYDTVHLIRDQFGFYYVSVFLPDQENNYLILKEATGAVGDRLKADNYQLPVDESSIVGWVAVNQQPYVSHSVAQDSIFFAEPVLNETQSELCIPFMARGKLLGVLDVQSRITHQFEEDSIVILQIMANQIAINIDNAQLFSQTESQLNETQILHDLNTLLTTTLEVGEIYRRAVREFALKLDATRCAISSWEKEEGRITTQAEFVHDPRNHGDEYVTTYKSYSLSRLPETEKVLKTHSFKLYDKSDPNLDSFNKAELEKAAQKIAIELPLVHGVEALGTIKLYRDRLNSLFTQQEIRLIQAMANQTAVSLNNAILTSNTRGQLAQFSSLHRMSVILSQASNLKAIFDGARREVLSLVEATGMSISLLVENGAKLNWIYGYEFGQEVDLSAIPPLPVTEGFSGQVARTREVLYVSKANEVREAYDSVTVGADLGCWLGLPLIVTNKLIGVLAVENDTEFTDRDVELLKTIAGPLAIAIHNLIQLEEIQTALKVQMRQRIQLETAAEVAASATSILDVQELMQNAVDLIKDRFELYYVGLFLVEEETNQAVLHAGTGSAGEKQIAEGRCLEVGGKSLIGGATADGKPRIIQDVRLDSEWLENPHLPETRSELALPLRVRGKVIGALTVQSVIPDIFDPDLLNILQTMSDQLAIAMENARLLSKAESEAHRQQLIHQISSQFYQSVDVNSIVKLGLEAISQRLGGTNVQLTLGTKSKNEETPGY